MSYVIHWTKQFKKDYKLALKRGKDITKLDDVIRMLSAGIELPKRYHNHFLTGEYEGFQECNIEPDWLLLYIVIDGQLVLSLSRTGSHSDLFRN